MSRRATTIARWPLALGLVVVPLTGLVPASAYWTGQASGTGSAAAATLDPVPVQAVAELLGDTVHISWAPPSLPHGQGPSGIRVLRLDPGGDIDVCGGSAAQPLAGSATACDDLALPDGDHAYRVVAEVGSWTTSGTATATVAADHTAPNVSLTATSATHAHLVPDGDGYRLFIRPDSAGVFTLAARVQDGGSGPASAAFPSIDTPGWSHLPETITSGAPAGDATVYASSPFAFDAGAGVPTSFTILGRDARDNEGSAVVTVRPDGNPPTHGALRVNGVTASHAGSLSMAPDSYSIDAVTAYAETAGASESGIASSTLTRAAGVASNGACTAFGEEQIVGDPAPVVQDQLDPGCHRYTLAGVDQVGNRAEVSTTVLLDASPPIGGLLTAAGVAATVDVPEWLTSTGTWSLAREDFVDPQSGMDSSVLTRSTATLSEGSCGAFGAESELAGSPTQSSAGSGCYRYSLVGTNAAGRSSTIGITVQADRDDPTGGAFRVDGTWASSGVPVIDGSGDSVTITSFSDYSDGESGLAGSTLSLATAPMAQGACGDFSGERAIDAGSGTITGLVDGCHRITLTGVDRAGNSRSIAAIVRIDTSVPAGGSIVVNDVDSASGAMAYTSTSSVPVSWTLFDDLESGMASTLLRRVRSTSLSNGVCGSTFSSATTLSTATSPSLGSLSDTLPTAGRCYRYELTGTDSLGLSSTASVTLMYDSSGPSATGSLVVNGSTGTTGGRVLTNTTGSVSITQRRSFSDSQSGIASDEITRRYAPLSDNACGAYDPPVVVEEVLPIDLQGLPSGCYLFTQTGTNGVGTSSAVSVIVKVDTTPPNAGALVANDVAGAAAETFSFSTVSTWLVTTTTADDPETGATTALRKQRTTTLNNGVCGSFGTASTITAPYSEPAISRGCVRYTLTGTNAFGLAAPVLTTTVMVDTTAPAGGGLVVNGVPATSGGSASVATGGAFSVSSVTPFSDAQSSVVAQVLTRTFGATCEALEPGTESELSMSSPISQSGLAPGCYRYVLSATNGVGGTARLQTDVTVP